MKLFSNQVTKKKFMRVQLKYAGLLALTSSTLFFFLVCVMAWMSQRHYELFTDKTLGVSPEIIQRMTHEQHLLENVLLWGLILCCLVMTVLSVYVVKKLMHPTLALKQYLFSYQYHPNRKEFRLSPEDDYLMLSDSINSVLNQVNSSVTSDSYDSHRQKAV